MPSNPEETVDSAALIAGLLEHGVLRIDTVSGFALASGGRSPVYIDHRRLFGVPGLREQALQLWAQGLRDFLSAGAVRLGPFEAGGWGIAGTATAGIAPAFGLAGLLGCPFAYVRSGAKRHGLGQMVEGASLDGLKVVVVDDMVTTGGSLLQAAKVLQDAGCDVVSATSFSSRQPCVSLPALEDPNAKVSPDSLSKPLPFFALFTLFELLEAAHAARKISDSDWDQLRQWLVGKT
jgi:orotate phosphoribosyltransferase